MQNCKTYKSIQPLTINDINKVEDLFLLNEYRVISKEGQKRADELFKNG